MLGDVNKLFVFKCLFTTPSNVLPLHLNQTSHDLNFSQGDEIESGPPFKFFSTLKIFLNSQISDLSSGSPSPKRSRRKSSDNTSSGADQASTVSMCNLVSPCSHEAKEAKNWSVEQVCRFVSTVEHCQPFVEVCIKVYSHQKYLSIKPKGKVHIF